MKSNNNFINQYFLSFIIIISFFSTFYFWDIKYLDIDFRILSILPLIFFLLFLKKSDLKTLYISFFIFIFFTLHAASLLLFDRQFNKDIIPLREIRLDEFNIPFNKEIYLIPNQFQTSIFLGIIFIVIYFLILSKFKKEIISNLDWISKILIIFLCFIFFNLEKFTSEYAALQSDCTFIGYRQIWLHYIFSEKSHFGMIFPSLFLFRYYQLIKSFNYFNLLFFILCAIFGALVGSTTLYIGLVASLIIIFFTNYKQFTKTKLIITSVMIVAIIVVFSFHKSCSRKFVDIKTYVIEKEIFEESNLLIATIENAYPNRKIAFDQQDLILYNNNLNLVISELTNFLELQPNSINYEDFLLKMKDLIVQYNLGYYALAMPMNKDIVMSMIMMQNKEILIKLILNKVVTEPKIVAKQVKPAEDATIGESEDATIGESEDATIGEAEESLQKLIEKTTSHNKKIINNLKKYQDLSILRDKEIEERASQGNFLHIRFDKVNMTTQVFLNSVLISYYSIIDRPLGWGFNRYKDAFHKHIHKTSVYFSKDIRWLNYNDGSSNFTKIITEFGIFSFLLFFVLAMVCFSNKIPTEIKFFFLPIVITQMIRGAGYFNGGFSYAIIILLILYFSNSKIKDYYSFKN